MLFTFKWQSPWMSFSIKVTKKAAPELPIVVGVCVRDPHGRCEKSRTGAITYWLGCGTDAAYESSCLLAFQKNECYFCPLTLSNSKSIDGEVGIFYYVAISLHYFALLVCKTIPTPKILLQIHSTLNLVVRRIMFLCLGGLRSENPRKGFSMKA